MTKLTTQIWYLFRKKSAVNKETLKSKQKIRTVYGEGEMGVMNKKFHNTHHILKYRIFIPALLLLERWIDKKIGRPNYDLVQLEYLKVFSESWDEATAKWSHYYIQQAPNKEGLQEVRDRIKNKEYKSERWLMTLKKVSESIIAQDDAYMEFLTFFTWEWHKKVAEHFKDKRNSKGKVHHIIRNYMGKIDPTYEQVYLQLRMTRDFQLREVQDAAKSE